MFKSEFLEVRNYEIQKEKTQKRKVKFQIIKKAPNFRVFNFGIWYFKSVIYNAISS